MMFSGSPNQKRRKNKLYLAGEYPSTSYDCPLHIRIKFKFLLFAMTRSQDLLVPLTVEEILQDRIGSLRQIEEQISKALHLIPSDGQSSKFSEIRCLLNSAVENIKNFSDVCKNEGKLQFITGKIAF